MASLQDQVGAIGVIDELRHRQMAVLDHVNLPERRREVAASIKAFFKAKGLEVDANAVEEGVRQYFDRRLSFDAPKIGGLHAWFAKVFVRRSLWAPRFMLATAVTTVAILGLAGFHMYRKSSLEQEALQSVKSLAESLDLDRNRLAKSKDKYARLNRDRSAQYQSEVRLGGKVKAAIEKAEDSLTVTIPSARQILADPSKLDVAGHRLEVAHRNIESAEAVVDIAGQVHATHVAFRQVIVSNRYLEGVKRFGALITLAGQVETALASADTSGGASIASERLLKLQVMVDDIDHADAVQRDIGEMLERVTAAGLDGDASAAIHSVLEGASKSLSQLDVKASAAQVSEAKALLEVAKQPLNLAIVDRKGVKSGVERTYKASGGKSWFVVVELVNDAGKAIPFPVTSSETGQRSWASLFAVRVSKETYDRVKADKRADGHIDEREIGEKRRGALDITSALAVSKKPELILEW